MLDVNQRPVSNYSSTAQWIYKAIGLSEVRLRMRLRGNDLHILCESQHCPDINTVIPRLLQALKSTDGVLPNFNPEQPIYQLFLYGRALEQRLPSWVEPIYLNQLDRHWERWQPVGTSKAVANDKSAQSQPPSSKQSSALIVSNETLAKSGAPDAIARYLSEILSSMGVSVRVVIEVLRHSAADHSAIPNPKSKIPNRERRLWVICNSDYSPDPAILAEPVAERLRKLKLKGFRDAILRSQVSGENKPDWLLRIDLTPPETMLKDWARWGDLQAITRLLNQPLLDKGIKIRGVLKENTLHLFCSRKLASATAAAAPVKEVVIKAVVPLLESIAPQGIHRATIYGVKVDRGATLADQEQPDWLELIKLPAAEHLALEDTTLTLAQQGDKPALLFLIERFLHPNLDWRLVTGGIRVQIHSKQDLLHIMTEAPVCPTKSQVGPPIAKFIRQLRLPKVAGVRVYGRRAGQTAALWSYGSDFVSRKQQQPQPTPQFAASEVWSGDDIIIPLSDNIITQPEILEDQTAEQTEISQSWGDKVYQWLLDSQLLITTTEDTSAQVQAYAADTSLYSPKQSLKVAFVWGSLGLLLMIQSDWLIGQLLQRYALPAPVATKTVETTAQILPKAVPIPQMSLQKSRGNKGSVFSSPGFTRTGETEVIVRSQDNGSDPFGSPRANAATTAILAAARSQSPSFNNRFLDEKLALYQQRLMQRNGIPPEVLIVGSSRAMRGVDPVALKNTLAAQGYADVEVFNFGINGATAQVVDLLVRRILSSSQLPKLIIWADGARAFNSGRADHTFQAMATSVGYQQLESRAKSQPQKTSDRDPNSAQAGGVNAKRPTTNTQTSAVSTINNWLNTTLENFSSTYSQREQLKALLSEQFAKLTPSPEQTIEAINHKIKADPENSLLPLNDYAMGFDGFLPVSSRFNPSTYYKKYAKVSGDYDSDYDSFQLSGEQDLALQSLLQFAQLHKISIVFINLPLTKEYLDPVRLKHEQEFQRYMRQIAIQKGIIFRELSQLWPNKNDYFSDPSHLNRYGANAVSNQLVKDPMIPWPSKF